MTKFFAENFLCVVPVKKWLSYYALYRHQKLLILNKKIYFMFFINYKITFKKIFLINIIDFFYISSKKYVFFNSEWETPLNTIWIHLFSNYFVLHWDLVYFFVFYKLVVSTFIWKWTWTTALAVAIRIKQRSIIAAANLFSFIEKSFCFTFYEFITWLILNILNCIKTILWIVINYLLSWASVRCTITFL